jgi:high affinity cGMP-specific 3',5'-cyclic phosphodiesterase 9
MQAAYHFLRSGCGDVLTALERVVLLVSCLGHDIDHPGFANVFQKQACTSLAIRYNDTSVLESHHCSSLFAILSNAACDVFAALPRASFGTIRQTVIELILATDLAQHKTYIDRLAALDLALLAPLAGRSAEAIANADAASARRVLLCGLIKCADLCNEIRTFALSQRWVPLVLEEFFAQGDVEKQRGFPVGFTNDRDKVTGASSQIGFIKFLCLPLYGSMVRVAPSFQACIDNLNANLNAWQRQHDEQQQQQQK